jgi:hypothetical protein
MTAARRGGRLLAAAAAILACAGTRAEGIKNVAVAPFCYYAGLEVAGAALAAAAVRNPNPWVFGAGATFKVADLAINAASDIGAAAIARRDRWLDAQMVLSGDDAQRLERIKAAGGDLDGAEAQAIKARLRARVEEIESPQRGRLGYTTAVILDNMPYAVAEVGVDKLIEKSVGLALEESGAIALFERFVPVPAKVNWALNYGGPLADAERAGGWRKLGTLAREAEAAADEELRDQAASIVAKESEAVANFLSKNRAAEVKESFSEALVRAYEDEMREHPSAPRALRVGGARLEAVRAAAAAPAPAPVALVAAPTPAIRPLAAWPADPVVRVLDADDRAWSRREAAPRATPVAPPPPVWQPSPPSAADQARWAELHAELMRVGDGKTFAVCSNGCPATAESSWDGRRKQTLYGQ